MQLKIVLYFIDMFKLWLSRLDRRVLVTIVNYDTQSAYKLQYMVNMIERHNDRMCGIEFENNFDNPVNLIIKMDYGVPTLPTLELLNFRIRKPTIEDDMFKDTKGLVELVVNSDDTNWNGAKINWVEVINDSVLHKRQ